MKNEYVILFSLATQRYIFLPDVDVGNIRASNKMIVMEACAGLVLGAMMERMGVRFNVFMFIKTLPWFE